MAQKCRTITVEAPDKEYPTPDQMEVTLSGFEDMVYIKWPDYGRADRKIRKMIESEAWDAETVKEAAAETGYLSDEGLPLDARDVVNTNDYCLKKETVMQWGHENRVSSGAECDIEYLLDAAEYFVNRGEVPCNRTGNLFPIPEWATPTGSYVATISAEEAGKCPNCGVSKDSNWVCYESSRRTRVPDKYKCEKCGHKARGITTG